MRSMRGKPLWRPDRGERRLWFSFESDSHGLMNECGDLWAVDEADAIGQLNARYPYKNRTIRIGDVVLSWD